MDLHNMLTDMYMYHVKSRRWYLYFFYHTLMIATVNSWLLYRRKCAQLQERHTPLKDYRAGLQDALFKVGNPAIGRPSLKQTPPQERRKRSIFSLQNDARCDGVDHLPVWNEMWQKCKLCHTKSQNRFIMYHAPSVRRFFAWRRTVTASLNTIAECPLCQMWHMSISVEEFISWHFFSLKYTYIYFLKNKTPAKYLYSYFL